MYVDLRHIFQITYTTEIVTHVVLHFIWISFCKHKKSLNGVLYHFNELLHHTTNTYKHILSEQALVDIINTSNFPSDCVMQSAFLSANFF